MYNINEPLLCPQHSKGCPVLCPRFRGHRIGHFHILLSSPCGKLPH